MGRVWKLKNQQRHFYTLTKLMSYTLIYLIDFNYAKFEGKYEVAFLFLC